MISSFNTHGTKIILFLLLLAYNQYSFAQYKDQLSPKLSVTINTNLETYFFAERLAVEHINDYVFDQKGGDYAHQPIVHYGFLHFGSYVNTPVILRIAELLEQIKNIYHDNGPIMDYLINEKEFPARGHLFEGIPTDAEHPQTKLLFAELTDSLYSFYRQAKVGEFLKENAPFYHGALKEVEKDIDIPSFPAMEAWHGHRFPQYSIFLTPGMPIPKGEDNYRGYGPLIITPKGTIPAMVISSDKMLPLEPGLSSYKHFGFDNPAVTRFLTKHEIGHSFVNPILKKYADQLQKDSALYTPELKQILAPHYINNWYICVIEHLVRLGEIRTALSMNDLKEAERLRKIHIQEYKCVLIPMLETRIREYELNRKRYPTFESYLPQLIAYLHSLTPAIINEQIKKFN